MLLGTIHGNVAKRFLHCMELDPNNYDAITSYDATVRIIISYNLFGFSVSLSVQRRTIQWRMKLEMCGAAA